MVENASLFLAYGELQNFIRHISHRAPQEKLPLHHLAIAAAGAGAITSFLLCVGLSFSQSVSVTHPCFIQNPDRACQMQNASSDACSASHRC